MPKNVRGDSSHLVSTGFVLTGSMLDIDQVSQATELSPTAASGPVETMRMPDGTPYIREAFWSLDFKKEAVKDTETALCRLLDVIWSKRNEILTQARQFDLDISFYSNITINEGYAMHPVCLVESATLEKMSFFGAEYIVDVFDYRESRGGSWMKNLEEVRYDDDAMPLISLKLQVRDNALESADTLDGSFLLGDSPLREERADDLDVVIANFLAQDLGGPFGAVLAKRNYGPEYLRATVLVHENRPVYSLGAESLKMISKLGCGFILEIFDYAE